MAWFRRLTAPITKVAVCHRHESLGSLGVLLWDEPSSVVAREEAVAVAAHLHSAAVAPARDQLECLFREDPCDAVSDRLVRVQGSKEGSYSKLIDFCITRL